MVGAARAHASRANLRLHRRARLATAAVILLLLLLLLLAGLHTVLLTRDSARLAIWTSSAAEETQCAGSQPLLQGTHPPTAGGRREGHGKSSPAVDASFTMLATFIVACQQGCDSPISSAQPLLS
jgi:hypothetical protein